MAINIAQTSPRLQNITIKPIYACGANCFFCSPRQDLYDDIRSKRERVMSIEDWSIVLRDAAKMGVLQTTISGGEPTLYKNVVELVTAIKNAGMRSSINTNGLNLHSQISALVEAGLNDVTISIYSHLEEHHDKIKGRAGLWKSAMSSINSLIQIRDQENLDLTVGLYFIVLRKNFHQINDFLQFAKSLDVDYIFMSHLQSELENKEHYLTRNNFIELNNLKVEKKLSSIINFKTINDIKKINTFFNLGLNPKYDAGQYLNIPSFNVECNTPNEFCIILPNGDVHACNMVENSHDGVIGNVLDMSLNEVFYGLAASRFRIEKHNFCNWCSVPLNVKINLR